MGVRDISTLIVISPALILIVAAIVLLVRDFDIWLALPLIGLVLIGVIETIRGYPSRSLQRKEVKE